MKHLQMAHSRTTKSDLWNEYIAAQTIDNLATWQYLDFPHTLSLGWNRDTTNNHTLYIRRKSFMCYQMYIWYDLSIDQAQQQLVEYFNLEPKDGPK